MDSCYFASCCSCLISSQAKPANQQTIYVYIHCSTYEEEGEEKTYTMRSEVKKEKKRIK